MTSAAAISTAVPVAPSPQPAHTSGGGAFGEALQGAQDEATANQDSQPRDRSRSPRLPASISDGAQNDIAAGPVLRNQDAAGNPATPGAAHAAEEPSLLGGLLLSKVAASTFRRPFLKTGTLSTNGVHRRVAQDSTVKGKLANSTESVAAFPFPELFPVARPDLRSFGLDQPDAVSGRRAPLLDAVQDSAAAPVADATGPTERHDTTAPAKELGECAIALKVAEKQTTPQAAVKDLTDARRVAALEPQPGTPTDAPSSRSVVWTAGETAAPAAAPRKQAAPEPAPVESTQAPAVAERPSRPDALRTVSIELHQADQERVEVRLSQRLGELHVAVRASDAELSKAMRQDLPQLVGRVEHEGHRVEGWRPSGIVTAAGPAAEAQKGGSMQNSPDDSPQDGSSRRDQEKQDQQQHRQQALPQWVQDMEDAFAAEQGDSYGIGY